MRLNTILAPVTVGLVIFTVVTIVNHVRQSEAETEEVTTATEKTAESTDDSAVNSSERSILEAAKGLLVVGVSSKIPIAEDYMLLKKVPWDIADIPVLFRDAGTERSCELLEFGADVVQPLIEPQKGVSGKLGRRSAFSIRLQIGKELGKGLPGVTRGIIEDYLKSHQLTIQPSFYHDEDGRVILSPLLKAAFVRLDSPDKSVPAEAMIATSISELRTLGAYWPSDKKFTPADCRTLILGFRYTLDEAGAVTNSGNPKREFEIVVLHMLPGSTAENPKLAVFATSDGRTQFHLLEQSDPDSVEQVAAITADVRFADTELMGMIPRAPVVTQVRHLALMSLPVEVVKSQVEGLGEISPGKNFSDMLDEYYAKAKGGAPADEASAPAAASAADTPAPLLETPAAENPVK